MEPEILTLDDDKMMRWSQTGSSSLMMCEDKNTVVPSSATEPSNVSSS